MLTSTVEPVVVMAETDSNTALVKVSCGAPNTSGRLAKPLTLTQLKVVSTNICRGLSSMGVRNVDSHTSPTAARTMRIDRPKARASGSRSMTRTSQGMAMKMASTAHRTDMTFSTGVQLRQ